MPIQPFPTSGEKYENLKDFYDFLSDNRESVYDTRLTYMRSGPYEQRLRRDLKEAWKVIRKAPIILNRLNYLVPAEVDGKATIYLGAPSEYKSVMQSAFGKQRYSRYVWKSVDGRISYPGV